jgi:hypothetical protein
MVRKMLQNRPKEVEDAISEIVDNGLEYRKW